MTEPNDLPEFQRPPIAEVVLGVAFQPIQQFLIPYLGDFWRELGEEEFPTCQEAAPLAMVSERAEGSSEVEFPALVPRVWFVHRDEAQIVQVQRDRFLCNWRKTREDHQYPRYSWVSDQFGQRLAQFEGFVEKRFDAKLQVKQFELTYINHFFADSGWQGAGDLARLMPDLSWRSSERFLPTPDAVSFSASFQLPSNAGRLQVRGQNGVHQTDQRPVFVLDLTARGLLADREEWFELAHDWIVRGFTDLTSDSVQSTAWGRTK